MRSAKAVPARRKGKRTPSSAPPPPEPPARRLVVLLGLLALMVLGLVVSAPYRARLARQTEAMRRGREESQRLRSRAEAREAERRRREAQVAAAIAARPSDPATQLHAGLEYLELGEPRQAVSVLEPLAKRQPGNPEVRSALGQAYEGQRWLDRALDEYRAARRLAPGDSAHDLRLASLLSRLAWRKEAMAILRGTVAGAPENAGARIALAMLLFQTGDLRGAEAQLGKAGAIEPENPAVPGLLADIADTAGQRTEARQAIERALRLQPENADFLALRASLSQAAGDPDGAERDARASLAAQPDNARAREILARALQARGGLAEALATLEPLLNRPNCAESTLTTASQLARRLGDPRRAADLLRRARQRQTQRRAVERLTYRADLSPADPRLRLQLGQVYLASGDAPRAVVELRRALELRPEWEAARRLLRQARAANGE